MMRTLIALLPLLAMLQSAVAQQTPPEDFRAAQALLQERWFEVSTANFRVFSQLSRGDSERMARDLEQWREAAITVLGLPASAVRDPLTTHVYVFDSEQALRAFTDGQESAYYTSSPRAAYLAMIESDAAMDLAQHHLAHYLINNQPIGMPRWYEEGMAHYLSRLGIESDMADLRALPSEDLSLAIDLNDMLGLDALLYDDSALSSPRVIQVANFKAGLFMHFLLHAHEVEGFADRREQLRNYVALLQEGRTERFAFDQAFDAAPGRLAGEYLRFLQAVLAAGDPQRTVAALSALDDLEAEQVSEEVLTLALGELTLHSGRLAQAQFLFDSLVQEQTSVGRAYSGLADAIRMQVFEGAESAPDLLATDLRSLYLRALATQENDSQLFLDYGQYLDTELSECERSYTEAERREMEEAMRDAFSTGLSQQPDSAEVNLSYARLFLLPGKNWQEGESHQRKAFATLPADTYVMEQAIDYAIAAGRFEEARGYVTRLARPMHFWGVPEWVTDLRTKLDSAEQGLLFEPCAATTP